MDKELMEKCLLTREEVNFDNWYEWFLSMLSRQYGNRAERNAIIVLIKNKVEDQLTKAIPIIRKAVAEEIRTMELPVNPYEGFVPAEDDKNWRHLTAYGEAQQGILKAILNKLGEPSGKDIEEE